jgi:hypothetical protein
MRIAVWALADVHHLRACVSVILLKRPDREIKQHRRHREVQELLSLFR